MTRDLGLETLLREDLADVQGLTEVTMFGGRCWLSHGKLLCGARTDGLLVRLGREQAEWALTKPDVAPMTMGARHMRGWVRAGPAAYGDDGVRAALLAAALRFVEALPAEER